MKTRESRRCRRNERGSILVLSTVGVVLAIISGALAIDLGFLAHEIRVDQKVADLAALDAVRMLPADPTAAAQQSATRNGFPYANPGYNLVVEWAPTKTGPWSTSAVALPGAAVVKVSATSPHTNFFPFVPGGQSKTRSAIAGNLPEAAFSVGSSLAALDTQKSLLDPILGNMLGSPTAVNMSAVSYSGLASGNVGLAALQTQLVGMGYDVGTTDKLLANNVKVADLIRASALALTAQGDSAAAAEVNDIPLANIPNLPMINLGRLVNLSQPGSDSALETTLNVFQMITGAAAVANGNSFVSVPGVSINVPGVATVGFELKVIEPAQMARGPVGVSAQTSQVTLRLKIVLLPVVFLGPTIALDLDFEAARGTGTLTAINCGALPSITVAVSTAGTIVSGGASTALGSLTATGTLAAGSGGSLSFSYPSEFVPPVGSDADGKRVSGSTLDLSPAVVSVTGNGAAAVTAALVQTLIPTILTAVDTLATPLLQPVLRALGADLAAADVTALGIYETPPACGLPSLVA